MKKEYAEHIEKILLNLPKTPGVYQMKNAQGEVLYVGKAKNLKSRVSSYFLRTADLSVAKRQMVNQIADIETLSCATEVEALVLETNLIKHLTPKYNILMKDDKNLAYIKITNSPVPEVIKTRQRFEDGGTYFGPFPSGVETALVTLRKIFKIRNCRVKFAQKKGENAPIITEKAGKTIPCMDYYIGICPGPCLLTQASLESHRENIARFRDFFSGKSQSVLTLLEEEMKEKAKNLEFEKAQEIKESLVALKSLQERQIVRDGVLGNIDIFIMYEKYEKVYIGFTRIESGKIVRVSRYEVELGIDEKETIIEQFLVSEYQSEYLPDILLLETMDIPSTLISFFKDKGISVEFPKIGPKRDLLDFTNKQVREFAYKKELSTLANSTVTKGDMENILRELGYSILEKKVLTFECYDISHTDGHFTYASRVVMENGKMVPKKYKKYKIRSLNDGDIDDFASHREVMRRRTLESLEESNAPDLIIIDGGKGQLSAAVLGIEESLSMSEKSLIQNICSLAKREEEVFIPGVSSSVRFPQGSGELMVLQKLRDESHRFSLSANISARMKSMKKNILEEIPGIGPKTRKKLLSLAGTVDGIKNLTLQEISLICTKKQIEILRDHGIIHLS